MNEQDKSELIRYRLSKSRETLSEAILLIEHAYWNAAINRLYYSCYYAVTALLLNSELQTKTHSGTRQMFGLHYVSKGIIHADSGRLYSELFSKRQAGDYEDMIDNSEEDVKSLVSPTRAFIDEIESILLQGTNR